MRERPILMSGPLVRAVLDGRKIQTRRLIQSPAKNMQRAGMKVIQHREPGDPWYRDHVWSMRGKTGVWGDYTHDEFLAKCPHGQVGDRLWVREAWQAYHQTSVECDEWEICEGPPSRLREEYSAVIEYRATSQSLGFWRPSIHMPRWASRLSLVITDVRVERLQSISEEDAKAEGVEPVGDRWRDYMPEREAPTRTYATARESFLSLWESVYGTASLVANPWVWCVSFEREVTP